MQDQIAAVKREQESVAVWDDSVINAKAGNQTWMAENFSVWMYSYYGHNRVYVLDNANRPVHAMREGKVVSPAVFGEDEPALRPTIARLRQMMSKDASQAGAKFVADDLVSLGGQPAILSVMPLVPSSDRVTQASGSEYLHVSIEFINDAVIGKIAQKYLLAGAHLLPMAQPLGSAAIPLIDKQGVILGYIAWDQERPGLTLVGKASPALALAALVAASVLAFLLRRLRRASSALQTSQAQAQYLAFHDTLTGLPNRALFEDRLRRALLTSGNESKVALLYLDLDRFKHVNDTLGHPAGDELVRQTAARLQHTVRDVDTVARLGGDEFAVILIDVRDVRNAEDISERVLQKLQEPFKLMDDQVFISASIGIALSTGPDADADDLLRKADIALYEAKKNGRGRYQVFAGDMDDLLLRKRKVESELRSALNGGTGIKLAYQPVFASDGKTIVGAEALIRWAHEVHGALPAAQFIAIAEERGMIGQLGAWALLEACRFAVKTKLPWLAVNVSPLQLRDAGFAEEVASILAETGLAPKRLQLEITENVLLENNDTTRAALAALRQSGVGIVLDDFGTGYSSLSYLRRHAIDKLKIDRSFVRLLDGDGNSGAIVKALIDLAGALKVEVTAEGVETEVQKALLVAMGCQQLQGYLLSPPLEPAQLVALPGLSSANATTEAAASA
ncbi:diguanylate phosphodiesterase [Mesorhizobium sp. LSHC422A00]|nr:diguanylate phosphodiesterase [Mesorhizobium sp. LSJC277A00]ESX52477.1 diguanylate phosphodiesterase [Mesorhizobium sp. LSHC426A00]ESX56876.1 diguanylate phosphodiesterase [Mesorhizobium sp. LSHC422A00]ESX58615.1 diguanylate phosphodiesterase [Mesorhizobium sp. LSHC424B00]ESY11663.1 diguanylate phosphodiesterase [Mesorhizobium sp. LNJC398B00]ESY25903.1 diguanylate phosphodiesterase [Mesorhizobium sp. LNJC395A00]ESY37459.1 diguanylate phosphodiesterase [Mesorhizobium sp. LNJC386A00]ESZ1003